MLRKPIGWSDLTDRIVHGCLLSILITVGSVPWQDDAFTLTPIARIGCVMCGGADEFGAITALSVGTGHLVAGDRDAPHIRVYRLDGTPVMTAAPEGDGPTEMRFPLAVSVAGSTVTAVDMRLARILTLDLDGTVRHTTRLPQFPMAASFGPGGVEPDVATMNFQTGSSAILRLDTGGGAWNDLLPDLSHVGLSADDPVSFFSLARAANGRLALGLGMRDYRIVLFNDHGSVERRVERDIPRIKKSPREIEAEREANHRAASRISERMPQVGQPPTVEVDPLRRHFSLDALRFDESGRLWVRTDRGDTSTVMDVFDAHGTYLGDVTLPVRITTFAVGDGHMVAAVLDDNDVPFIQIWRLARELGDRRRR